MEALRGEVLDSRKTKKEDGHNTTKDEIIVGARSIEVCVSGLMRREYECNVPKPPEPSSLHPKS